MMEKHSTPAGIEQLETQVHNFAQKAGGDVVKLVKNKFGAFVNKSAPMIKKAMGGAIDTVSNNLGHSIASSLATPLGQALAPALESMMKQMLHDNGTAASQTSHNVGKQLAAIL